ncbi:MAG: S8 family serine peptidase, partial [Patescibacteria group bacterium]
MNFMKKYFVLFAILSAVFVTIAVVGVKVEASKPDSSERVIAHTNEEVNKAISSGCKVVREVQTLKALRCPHGVATSLSLTEDVRVFALRENSSLNEMRRPNGNGTSAYTGPLNQIGADVVHNSGNTGSGRKIVVLDTGYNRFHPELISSYLGGKDFVNNDDDPMDDEGHGSHVSGIITADGIDPKAKGVAPDAGVIAGKVLD